jgi:5'-3' exonuclease
MPILVDFHPVVISEVMALNKVSDTDEKLVRHATLNSIMTYKTKFAEYGQIVICCDDQKNWRKDIFPYYKMGRKAGREKSSVDWNMIFDILDILKKEMKEVFPYKVIQVDYAEADDIIGVLCKNATEKTIIISSDKDMKQLLRYDNVDFYSIYHKIMMSVENPKRYLQEHIMRGDAGDGVPNFLSDGDTLINPNKRQKPVRTKLVDEWVNMDLSEFCDAQMLKNYERNRNLIDLECIPKELQKKILNEYETIEVADGKKAFNYFVKHGLKQLMGDLPKFL